MKFTWRHTEKRAQTGLRAHTHTHTHTRVSVASTSFFPRVCAMLNQIPPAVGHGELGLEMAASSLPLRVRQKSKSGFCYVLMLPANQVSFLPDGHSPAGLREHCFSLMRQGTGRCGTSGSAHLAPGHGIQHPTRSRTPPSWTRSKWEALPLLLNRPRGDVSPQAQGLAFSSDTCKPLDAKSQLTVM